MKTSNNGIALIKKFEGCKLFAYKCLKSERFYTIGYGHYGADVKPNSVITIKQADDLLKKDIVKFEKLVNKYQNTYNFNQNEYDALVSFAYNVGNIDRLTQYGKRPKENIAKSFTLYCYSNGQKLQGLYDRRKAESELFTTPCEENIHAEEYDKSLRGKYTVHCNSLRLRKSPNGTQIGSIKKGEQAICYGYHTGKWLYVTYKNLTGFIYNNTEYIRKTSSI